MQTSVLHIHSVGTVTSVPAIGSKDIHVRLKERKFGNQDELLDNPTNEKVAFNTTAGADEVVVTHSDSVTATWFNRNSNRVSAPNVRRGDEVVVWRVAETEKYLWELRSGPNMRLETVIYAFSADPSKPIADDFSNAYTFEVSSHNKSITFSTSKANGEPFAFIHQYDLETGVVVTQDDIGNMTYHRSREHIIGMSNTDGTVFEINRRDIIGNCSGAVDIDAKNIDMSAESIRLKASNVSIDADVSIDGDVSMNGGLSVKGAVGVTGSLKLNGRNVKTE